MTDGSHSISSNEIDFYVTRAAVGAGASFGIAEDFATAVTWAARFGDPAPAALACLNQLDSRPQSGRLTLSGEGAALVLSGQGPLSAIYVGPALADFVQLPRAKGAILKARDVDYPMLAVAALASNPAIACAIEWLGVRMTVGAGEISSLAAVDREAFRSDGPVDITLVDAPRPTPRTDAAGYCPDAAQLNAEAHRIAREGITVDPSAWRGVVELFNRCLVPSSEQSLAAGAGAGLVDTD